MDVQRNLIIRDLVWREGKEGNSRQKLTKHQTGLYHHFDGIIKYMRIKNKLNKMFPCLVSNIQCLSGLCANIDLSLSAESKHGSQSLNIKQKSFVSKKQKKLC